MHKERNFERYIDDIEMPQDIKKRWKDGLEKAKKEEGITLKKIIKGSSISVALLALCIMVGALASPTFASGLEKMLFGKRLSSVSNDRDLQKSMNENISVKIDEKISVELPEKFKEEKTSEIEKSSIDNEESKMDSQIVENGDFEFRMTDAFLDSRNSFFMFELEGPREEIEKYIYFVGVGRGNIRYKNGEEIMFKKVKGTCGNEIEVVGDRAVKKGYIQTSAKIQEDRELEISVRVDALDRDTLDKTEIMKEVVFNIPPMQIKEKYFEIGEKFSINTEEVLIDKLVVSPMRSSLILKWDSDADFKILDVKSAVLKDNKGNQWVNVFGEDFVSGIHPDSEILEAKIGMESIYYEDIEELYLDSIIFELIDKEESVFDVDVINKKVQEPYNKDITLIDVQEEDDMAVLTFRYSNLSSDDYLKEFGISKSSIESIHDNPDLPQYTCETHIDYNEKHPIMTKKFPKEYLKDVMKFEAGRGSGSIESYNINIEIEIK